MPLPSSHYTPGEVAVLVPCYNEEKTIAAVVRSFHEALPHAAVYVYDNNSADRTCDEARKAGAIVRRETTQGKGWVVRRMFADIEADYYVLVDGDDTYDASVAPVMVASARNDNLAMLVGRRIHESVGAYRPGHVLGNKVFTGSVASLFGRSFTDILSGYRVFSRASPGQVVPRVFRRLRNRNRIDGARPDTRTSHIGSCYQLQRTARRVH